MGFYPSEEGWSDHYHGSLQAGGEMTDWRPIETAPKDRDVMLRKAGDPESEQRACWCAASYYGKPMGWIGIKRPCHGYSEWRPIDG